MLSGPPNARRFIFEQEVWEGGRGIDTSCLFLGRRPCPLRGPLRGSPSVRFRLGKQASHAEPALVSKDGCLWERRALLVCETSGWKILVIFADAFFMALSLCI